MTAKGLSADIVRQHRVDLPGSMHYLPRLCFEGILKGRTPVAQNRARKDSRLPGFAARLPVGLVGAFLHEKHGQGGLAHPFMATRP